MDIKNICGWIVRLERFAFPHQVAVENVEGETNGVRQELWLHICLQYESPWRPTYLVLQPREAAFGELNCVPLRTIAGSGDP